MAANDNHCSHLRASDALLDEDSREPFIESLPFASQFAIWAARSWVTALKLEQPFEAVSGETFRRFSLLGAQRALDEMFTIVAHAAGRQIDIRCMKCRYVSPDEMIFHQALAAAQSSRAFDAYNELRQWLAPAAARIAFNALVRFGELLAQSKLTVNAYVSRESAPAVPDVAEMPMPSQVLH